MEIGNFKTLEGGYDIDLNADVGTTYALTSSSTVSIIDPFEEYLASLKSCFDFDALRAFCQQPGFSLLFDGMHGAGGPFARRVLVEELGLPEVRMTLSISWNFVPQTNGKFSLTTDNCERPTFL